MGNYLNKKDGITCVGALIFSLVLSFFFYKFAYGYYSAKYTESAHGNSPSGVGVNRESLNTPVNFGYSKGNCAHCHEQHASIDGDEPSPPPPGGPAQFLLFYQNPKNPPSQTDNFCYQCHKGLGSIQEGLTITNNTYSKNFGGGNTPFTTIYDAFNPTTGDTPSSHNLSDILSHAVKRNIGFTTNNNACVVCHNPHTAQENSPVVLSGKGGVKTAIRRPFDYATRNTNLWGDEDAATSGYNERMRDYDSRYQAPYYKGGTNYEPANNSTYDGSNLPNFVNFCTNQCHTRNDVQSSHGSINGNTNLIQIDWSNTGDQHGRVHDDSGLGITVAPYVSAATNYVLSCTDCHEPHGSENEWLLRKCVNGKDNINVPDPNRWLDFCTACHSVSPHYSPWDSTTDCNQNGVCHQHGNLF
jgi:hypothetical protein